MNDATSVSTEVDVVDPDAKNPLKAKPKWEPEKVFQLVHPVTLDGQQIGEITLRSPNGLDLFEVGGLATKTVWLDGGGMQLTMDTGNLRRWLERLSGKSMPVFYQISAKDMRSMYEWLNGELSSAGN